MDTAYAVKIAKLNDAYRRNGNRIVVTSGVQVLNDLSDLLDEIRWFDAFTEENDPYGEHDFGMVYWCGQKIFWKIDYYDRRLEYGTGPLSTECQRVMTVMLASEY